MMFSEVAKFVNLRGGQQGLQNIVGEEDVF